VELRQHGAALVTLAAAITLSACGDAISPDARGPALTPTAGQCIVRFTLVEGANVGTMDATVDLSNVAALPIADGQRVKCTPRVGHGQSTMSGVETSCEDDYDPACWGALHSSTLIDTHLSISAPHPLIDCLFQLTDEQPLLADQFGVTVFTAATPSFDLITPIPVVAVTDVDCATSVTTSTTSTTMPGCDGVACEDGEVCIDDVCTKSRYYKVRIGVRDENSVASLQLNVLYPPGSGTFVSDSDSVDCRTNPSLNAHASYNHVPQGSGRPPNSDYSALILGMISLQSVQTPAWIAECLFKSSRGRIPSVEIFETEVVDAANSQFQPIVVDAGVIQLISTTSPE
jgi:hypothetical protein